VTLLSPDGQRTLSVSGGADGAVRLWHPGTDRPGEPLGRRGVPVTAVAGGRLSTGPAVAAAWPDGLISLWDLSTGGQATIRLGFPVYALALGDDDTLVLGSEHGTTALRLTPRG
jgi:WD40 repeat protein